MRVDARRCSAAVKTCRRRCRSAVRPGSGRRSSARPPCCPGSPSCRSPTWPAPPRRQVDRRSVGAGGRALRSREARGSRRVHVCVEFAAALFAVPLVAANTVEHVLEVEDVPRIEVGGEVQRRRGMKPLVKRMSNCLKVGRPGAVEVALELPLAQHRAETTLWLPGRRSGSRCRRCRWRSRKVTNTPTFCRIGARACVPCFQSFGKVSANEPARLCGRLWSVGRMRLRRRLRCHRRPGSGSGSRS